MISNMAALEATASFWDSVSAWSALAVFLGVAAECVAEFETLANWLRLKTERAISITSKAGLLVLTAALAVEVIAAIQSHNTNEAIISGLNTELNDTIKQASNLEKLTEALGLSNAALKTQVGIQSNLLDKTGGALSILSKQNVSFEKAIRTQEDSNNADLASLKSDAAKLTEARNEILADAGKSAEAAAAAAKAQTDMTTALNAVQSMRQRMQDIITPRQIDDAHFTALVLALKPFSKTPIELAMTRDPESADLLSRIIDALLAADWTIQPFSGGGFGLIVNGRSELPSIGEITGRGVQINISESDREKFSPAVLALGKALAMANIQVALQAFPDKTADGKPDPRAVKAGTIHFIVGAKP